MDPILVVLLAPVVFVVVVVWMAVGVVWSLMLLAVLVTMVPAVGLALLLVELGLPTWAAVLVSALAWFYVLGEIDERRRARRAEKDRR